MIYFISGLDWGQGKNKKKKKRAGLWPVICKPFEGFAYPDMSMPSMALIRSLAAAIVSSAV